MRASSSLPIAIATGDPAGVGPRVGVVAAASLAHRTASVLLGDAAQLAREAASIGLEPSQLVACDEASAAAVPRGRIGVIDTGRVAAEVIARHAPSPEGGAAQLGTLARAAAWVRGGGARALVTGPTSKEAIVSAGHPFVGQTEFLARLDARADDAVTMLFLGPKLRVGLVTTHLSVARVPAEITEARVVRTTLHLAEALLRLIPNRARTLVVSGLNPHAGEGGLFGNEERDVIAPALDALRARAPFQGGDVALSGPQPAEAVFRAAQRGDVDGVVAMFHDQATIASKLLDWGAAVNTTWGLSFLRTSVDHGVAYDAARSGTADADGMQAALRLAVQLTGDGAAHG